MKTFYALGLAVAILAAVQAQASESVPTTAQRGGDSSAACESARLSAWFERQRQLTDGDVDPQKPADIPADCQRMADSGATRDQHAAEHANASRAAQAPMRHGPRS